LHGIYVKSISNIPETIYTLVIIHRNVWNCVFQTIVSDMHMNVANALVVFVEQVNSC